MLSVINRKRYKKAANDYLRNKGMRTLSNFMRVEVITTPGTCHEMDLEMPYFLLNLFSNSLDPVLS